MPDWYQHSGAPATASALTSQIIRQEFQAIQVAMAKLPDYTGQGGTIPRVNTGGTAQENLTIGALADLLAQEEFVVDDGVLADVTDVITITHTVTGTPANGIGTGLGFSVETAVGSNELGMTLDAVAVDVDPGNEDFDFVVMLMDGGAVAAEKMRVSSLGVVTATGATVTDLISNTLVLSGSTVVLAGDLTTVGAYAVSLTATGATGVTLPLTGVLSTLAGNETLTNKSLTSPSMSDPTINGGVSGTAILDEDTLVSNSATQLATQQSIKAYVDTAVATVDSLAELLALGNTTGGTGIIVSIGDILTVDTINETNVAGGVTIDGALIKDGGITSVNTVLNTGVTGTAVLDQDTMSSNSATHLATQQSIKAYVDSQVATVDTLAEILALSNFTGGTNIVVTAGDSITVDTISETTPASGVTIDGTLIKDGGITAASAVLNTGVSGTAILDEDNLVTNSDTQLATQQSIKAYVDAQVATVDTLAEVLALGNSTGGTNIIVTAGDLVTVDTINETTADAGVTVEGVLLKDGGITASAVIGISANNVAFNMRNFADDGNYRALRVNASDQLELMDGKVNIAANSATVNFDSVGIKVKDGAAGVAIHSWADGLSVEHAGNAGISILAGTNLSKSSIYFGNSSGNSLAIIRWDDNVDRFQIETRNNSRVIEILAANKVSNVVFSGIAAAELAAFVGDITVGRTLVATGAVTGSNLNVANWDTGYGWGDWAASMLDEDTLTTNSDTQTATQQSIKAYVDSRVATVDTLSELLALSNSTSGQNIVVTAGDQITVNTINETTAASGVTIDGVLLKDSGITATGGGSLTGTWTDLGSVTTVDINGGTLAGMTVDGDLTWSSAQSGLTVTSVVMNTGVSGTAILDEDNLGSNSDTQLATQQSIKAYIDAALIGGAGTLADTLVLGNLSGINDLIMDSGQKVTTNTIDETTAAAGVTIDGILIKDGEIDGRDPSVDGAKLDLIADNANLYVHPSSVVTNIATTNADVISTLNTDATGHITAMTKRTMTLSQLGYTGSATANDYSHPNHTGDVTSTGDGATVIAAAAVTLAKMANMATASIIGRNTAASGVPEILSATTVRSILGIEAGATADQTNTEIRDAVEAATDSNTFTNADHTKLNNIATAANLYVHPNHSGQVTSTADGATVLTVSAITAQAELLSGLASTDELVLSDAGVIKRMDVSVIEAYMQSNLAFNNYTHPSDGVDPGAALVGAFVFSDITVNAAGHVTGSATRELVPSDIGANGVIGTDSDINTSGADVLDTLTMTDGVITAHGTRTMTLSNLGYSGTVDANTYVHPNHSGQVTSTADGATVLTVSAITSQADIAADLVGTDEIVVSDGGVIKRADISALNAYLNANLSFSSTVGTVTSVGTNAGLSGTVTSSGSLSLDFPGLPDGTAAVVGSADEIIYLDAGVEKRKQVNEWALSQFNNDSGWTSNTGDITRVNITAGTGLDGSINTASGDHTQTITLDFNEIPVGGTPVAGDHIVAVNGTVTNKQLVSSYPLSAFNNDGFLTTGGDDIRTGGNIRFNDNIELYFGTGLDWEFFCDGSNAYMDLNAGIGNLYIRDGSTTRFTFDDAGHFTSTGTTKGQFLTTTGDSLWFLDGTNATATSHINYYGYNQGITQFRNTVINNGKGAAILTLTGSSKAAAFAGAVSAVSMTATGEITANTSDERLKTFHGEIENALDKLSRVAGYYYSHNETAIDLGFDADIMYLGVNAQEIQREFPEVIRDAPINKQPGLEHLNLDYITVHYEKLVPVLIQGVNQLSEMVDSLTEQVRLLKAA